jgi:hypothetical protein
MDGFGRVRSRFGLLADSSVSSYYYGYYYYYYYGTGPP